MEIHDLKEFMVHKETSLTKKIVLDTPDVLCFVLNLMPGQTIPEHQHEHSTLIATVLQGSATFSVDGQAHELSALRTLIVAGEDVFGIPSVHEKLSLHVTLSPNPSNPIFAKPI